MKGWYNGGGGWGVGDQPVLSDEDMSLDSEI